MNAGRSNGDIWIFGYGSLMWRPGFDYLEVHPARLYGYHRSFCVYSWHHRGSRDAPGLVLGLDRGGSCLGRAFRVASAVVDDTIAYLDAREMVTAVYHPIDHPVHMPGYQVSARCYIVDRTHPQYAGVLPLDDQAAIIAGARGQSGINRDYLENTITHLDDLGITDGPSHKVWKIVQDTSL